MKLFYGRGFPSRVFSRSPGGTGRGAHAPRPLLCRLRRRPQMRSLRAFGTAHLFAAWAANNIRSGIGFEARSACGFFTVFAARSAPPMWGQPHTLQTFFEEKSLTKNLFTPYSPPVTQKPRSFLFSGVDLMCFSFLSLFSFLSYLSYLPLRPQLRSA